MQRFRPFSDPQICPKDPKPADMSRKWSINFRFFNTDSGKQKQFLIRRNLNEIRSFGERLKEARAMCEAIRTSLRQGWNPITGKFPEVSHDPLGDINELSKMTFRDAVTFALSKCEAAPRTLHNYRNSANRIMKASLAVLITGSPSQFDFASLQIDVIKRKHIKYLLDHCRQTYKWSNKAFNKHMGYFRAVLARLEQYEVITGNPASRIKELPVTETRKFLPYTDEEKKRIREHLFIHNYGFFVYLMMIYHTGMRPNEVLALRVSDINMATKVITLNPDADRDNSKTKGIRLIPLVDSLFLLLREWLEHDHQPGCYIFGSPFSPGRGNAGSSTKGHGAFHEKYFRPSMTRIKRDTVTKLWKKVVIDTLQIKKHLYAAKHTGGDDKIMAGIDLEALKEMYGHTSKFMTMKYITKLKEIHHKQIIALSPDF